MPLKPIDYSKTVIYKLVCDEQPEFLYVGSTSSFVDRKRQHKRMCNTETDRHYNLKVYQQIRDVCKGWDNIKMIEIEKYPECIDRRDAERKEQFWIDELKSQANMKRAFRTEENKKEDKKIWRKTYYSTDEHIQQKKDGDKKYTDLHKEEKKQYDKERREKLAEELSEKRKEYYLKNKDQLTCECGSSFVLHGKAKHLKTKKHLLYISEKTA